MWGLGKKAISEKEAAAQCVRWFVNSATEVWPQVAEVLAKRAGSNADKIHTFKSSFEFIMACLSVQCQTLPNLFTSEQATRVLGHVEQSLTSLSFPEIEYQAIDCFRAYSKAWKDSLLVPALPMLPPGSVAMTFCLRTGLQGGDSNSSTPSIFFLSIVDGMITTCAGSFWKDLSLKYRLAATCGGGI